MSTALIEFIFFCSGISGLIYEVIWVRQFGNLFGNTAQSAALVTAIFMAGLGLGSYLSGKKLDQNPQMDFIRAVRIYALFELSIGTWGFILSLVTPHLEGLSSLITSYTPVMAGGASWMMLTKSSYALRLTLVTALTLPMTIAMGATLPALIKAVSYSGIERLSRKIAALYGINTLGAAIGALSVDFFLVPSFGLLRTQWLAAAINVMAGAGAWLLIKPGSTTLRAESQESQDSGRPSAEVSSFQIRGLSLALFFCGFVAMGLQLVWFRFLTGILEGTRAVFSLLLFTILVGIFLGSLLGGVLCKRNASGLWRKPVSLLMIVQTCLPIASFAIFSAFDRSNVYARFFHELYDAHPAEGSLIAGLFLIHPILIVVLIPAILTGFSFPVANAEIQNRQEFVGRRAGGLYLSNTYGAIAGSLVTGFVLIPRFGMQGSLTAVGIASLLAVFGLMISAFQDRPLRLSLAASSLIAVSVFLWMGRPAGFLLDKVYSASLIPSAHYLKKSEGFVQSTAVAETVDDHSLANRSLLTNGFMMSWTNPIALRYMHSFVHVPLLQMPNPQSALIICFGVGNTAGTAALYPSLSRIEIADLSEEVLHLAPYFSDWNRDVLKDPRTKVFVDDGREHLRVSPPASFDLITLEPPPLGHAGVASLYSLEFYKLARSRLKADGYMTQWLPLGQTPAAVTQAVIRAFYEVFPNVVLLSASNDHLILLGKNAETNTLDLRAVEERLESLPSVKKDLQKIFVTTPLEFVGMFMNTGEKLSRAIGESPPVTDDWPILEHWRMAFETNAAPPGLDAPDALKEWCPRCFIGDKPVADLKDFDIYSSFVHRTVFGRASGETPMKQILETDSPQSRVIRASPYLTAQVEGRFN